MPKKTNTSAPEKGKDAAVLAKGVEQSTSPASQQIDPVSIVEEGGKSPSGGNDADDASRSVFAVTVTEKAGEPVEQSPTVKAVIVTAQHDGFRRAGRAWSKAPTTVPIDELSMESIKVLMGDPLLSVEFVSD